jgi:hypothetical protein
MLDDISIETLWPEDLAAKALAPIRAGKGTFLGIEGAHKLRQTIKLTRISRSTTPHGLPARVGSAACWIVGLVQ